MNGFSHFPILLSNASISIRKNNYRRIDKAIRGVRSISHTLNNTMTNPETRYIRQKVLLHSYTPWLKKNTRSHKQFLQDSGTYACAGCIQVLPRLESLLDSGTRYKEAGVLSLFSFPHARKWSELSAQSVHRKAF